MLFERHYEPFVITFFNNLTPFLQGKVDEKQSNTTPDKDTLSTFSSDPSKQSDQETFSDPVNSGYSSMRKDSTTDSEFETLKEPFFSDDGLCASESDDDNLKNMRDIIDQKVRSFKLNSFSLFPY